MKPKISIQQHIACILALCFTQFLISCKKFVTIDSPQNQVESVKIFSNYPSAVSAVTGLYGMIGLAPGNFINGGITLYTGAASDELSATAASSDIDPFTTNSISPSHANLFTRLWRAAYNNTGIYSANAILAGLEKSTALTEPEKNQLTGEVTVLRALYYFYLVNLFGDVPLAITPDFETNALLARMPVTEIQRQIRNDLLYAFNTIGANYPTTNRARINKWAAASLLSRAWLYENDWPNAELYASMVINSGTYSLNPSVPAVFTSISSNETIWQLVRDNNPTADGATFIPSSATVKPTYGITPHLLTAFETGDLRKNAWLAKNTISGIDYYYPYKYKSRLATQPVEYLVVLRLAEQYLIRAEARARQGNLSGALSDLNTIRNRAGLANSAASTQTDIVNATLKERRTELFCEMGHRWLDLKRTGNASLVLTPIKGANWQATDVLFPIPQQELDKNPNLIQNPGY